MPIRGLGGKIFVASVSPQVKASIAATYGTTMQEAEWMIEQLLSGPYGIRTGGRFGNAFTWILDTNAMREVCLVLGAQELLNMEFQQEDGEILTSDDTGSMHPKKPVLSSACPGWICYVEKTHPYILPYLSRLKSPQALTGTLVKTTISKVLRINPSDVWHLAIMPCFDKKLEASRTQLTDMSWRLSSTGTSNAPVRDVDCVITARELLMLAETRGISFPSLPRRPLDPLARVPFPDPKLNAFLFPRSIQSHDRRSSKHPRQLQKYDAGSSGGFLYHILCTQQSRNPGSTICTERGRNANIIDYTLVLNGEVISRAARYYGFKNIQNLVRKLKPQKQSRLPGGRTGRAKKPEGLKIDLDYAYVEVMACSGGCTNGGGQIKIDDLGALQRVEQAGGTQKEWLARVDEAYFSMEDNSEDGKTTAGEEGVRMTPADHELIDGISTTYVKEVLSHWVGLTGIELKTLVFTAYQAVESALSKDKGREVERVVELAGKIGGGW